MPYSEVFSVGMNMAVKDGARQRPSLCGTQLAHSSVQNQISCGSWSGMVERKKQGSNGVREKHSSVWWRQV